MKRISAAGRGAVEHARPYLNRKGDTIMDIEAVKAIIEGVLMRNKRGGYLRLKDGTRRSIYLAAYVAVYALYDVSVKQTIDPEYIASRIGEPVEETRAALLTLADAGMFGEDARAGRHPNLEPVAGRA
jgi:hypothetical protein